MPIFMKHGGKPYNKAMSLKLESDSIAGGDFRYWGWQRGMLSPQGKPDKARKIIAALKRLGQGMAEQEPLNNDASRLSPMSGVFTYWGQFIDHDITANTDRDDTMTPGLSTSDEIVKIFDSDDFEPADRVEITRTIKNRRDSRLDLDSVYDGGWVTTEFSGATRSTRPHWMYDNGKFRFSDTVNPSHPGDANAPKMPDAVDPSEASPHHGERQNDLLRMKAIKNLPGFDPSQVPPTAVPDGEIEAPDNLPWIGDSRNDENLAIAQFHLAVQKFHNKAFDLVEKEEDSDERFIIAQRETIHHYQYIVLNDYLRQICDETVVDKVLRGFRCFDPLKRNEIPLEFSVAAFRFGHSMIRHAYDWNAAFSAESGTLDLLFAFSNSGNLMERFGGLPDNWPADFKRLVDPTNDLSRARKIDTLLVPLLKELPKERPTSVAPTDPVALQQMLAARNLLRGYRFSLGSGQELAKMVGLPVVDSSWMDAMFRRLATNQNGFDQGAYDSWVELDMIQNTPLWLYILAEAENQTAGDHLGMLGSHLVAETLVDVLRQDPNSILNSGFNVATSNIAKAYGGPILTIEDFLKASDYFL